MAAYNVNTLPDYVDQHRSELIAKAVLGATSAGYFNLMTGVKGETALNLIGTELNLQTGTKCGWNPEGDATLSQRIIKPAYYKVNMAICDKTLLKKWANYLVRVEANKTDRDLPFEKELTDGVIAEVNAKIEKAIYTGTGGDNIEGLLTILEEASAPTATGATAYDAIKATILKLKPEVLAKDDVAVLVGLDTYNEFMQQLVEKNYFHYNPANGANEYLFPGTNVKVIGVAGLNGGDKKIVGGSLSNIFYGTNLEDGQEIFDLWFSKDNREFRLAIEFTAGVQVAYPDELVVGTIG